MNRKQNILTVEELADLLRVEKGTIYKLVKAHKIPAFKIRFRPLRSVASGASISRKYLSGCATRRSPIRPR